MENSNCMWKNLGSTVFSTLCPFPVQQGHHGIEAMNLSFPHFFFLLQISSSDMFISGDGESEEGLLKAEPTCELFVPKSHGCVFSSSVNRSLSPLTLLQVLYGLSLSIWKKCCPSPRQRAKLADCASAELMIPGGNQGPRKRSLKEKHRKIRF